MTNNQGYTLIEVLIAMVLLAGGLLGLASLQASSLKSNQISYNRSMATQFAYDIADRMRANISAASNYITSANVPTAQNDCLTVTTTCGNPDMANNDLYQWNAAIRATLPDGRGIITCSAAGCPLGSIITVTINWDEDRNGSLNNDPYFNMSFQI